LLAGFGQKETGVALFSKIQLPTGCHCSYKFAEKRGRILVKLISIPGLTHLFQTGNMLAMHKQVVFGFYFYFFSNPLRPQTAEEVCLS
jgi:hypothetical protein